MTKESMNNENNEDLKYWVALHKIPGLGPVRFNMLEKHFGDLETAWKADARSLRASGITQSIVHEVLNLRNSLDPDDIIDDLERRDIKAIHLRSESYPELLSETADAPVVLYAMGDSQPQDWNGIAVIGTRSATRYGLEMCEKLSEGLASYGITVVSGLARGIDSVAHRSALNAGGRTIAVLPGGVDRIYPSENIRMAREIARNGCLLTEYSLGMRPLKEHFPRRNRVISGISRGVVVIEAPMKSGTMYTVKWALEQGREVFAVPGNATSRESSGTNWLIKQGAKLTTSVDDIIEELRAFYPDPIAAPKQQRSNTASQIEKANTAVRTRQTEQKVPTVSKVETHSKEEAKIVEALSNAPKPMHMDDIARDTAIAINVVSSSLTMMEIRGAVRCIDGTLYELTPARNHVVAPTLMDKAQNQR